MAIVTWDEGWVERVYDCVQRAGFVGVMDFSAGNPRETFDQLALMLGPGVAPIQVEMLQKREALSAGKMAWFARDCLSRTIRQSLPHGWGVGTNLEFQKISAFGEWVAALGSEKQEVALDVWRRLCGQAPPDDWLPLGSDDPHLALACHGTEFAPDSA